MVNPKKIDSDADVKNSILILMVDMINELITYISSYHFATIVISVVDDRVKFGC